MGETTGQASSGGSVPSATTSEFRAWSEDVEVQLGPADVWVLGQLIEAGTASFPPGIAQELMTGYRILQASGYQPPPHGQSSIELDASLEDPAETEGQAAADGDREPGHGGDGGGHEVLVTELADAPRQAGDDEPGNPPAAHSLLAREVVLTEVTTDPQPPRLGDDLAGHAEQAVASLERIADRVERALSAQADRSEARPDAGRAPTDARLRGATIDLGLVGANAATAALFVVAAALLADPVFSLLGLAATGLAAFLVLPYLDLPIGRSALREGEQELERLAGERRSPGVARRLRRLSAFGALALATILAAAFLAGNPAYAWGYAAAGALVVLLGGACAARVAAPAEPGPG